MEVWQLDLEGLCADHAMHMGLVYQAIGHQNLVTSVRLWSI